MDAAAGVSPVRAAAAGSRRAAVRAHSAYDRLADAGEMVAHVGALRLDDDRRALAELLLERQGIVTRDGVRGEGIRGGYGAVYAELQGAGDARRLPARVLRRGARRRAVRAPRRRGAPPRAPVAAQRGRRLEALVLAAADPAQPYGAALPWPRRSGARAAGSPAHGSCCSTARRRSSSSAAAARSFRCAIPIPSGSAGARRARRPRARGRREAPRRRALRRRRRRRDGRHAASRRGRLPRRPAARVLRP